MLEFQLLAGLGERLSEVEGVERNQVFQVVVNRLSFQNSFLNNIFVLFSDVSIGNTVCLLELVRHDDSTLTHLALHTLDQSLHEWRGFVTIQVAKVFLNLGVSGSMSEISFHSPREGPLLLGTNLHLVVDKVCTIGIHEYVMTQQDGIIVIGVSSLLGCSCRLASLLFLGEVLETYRFCIRIDGH